MSLLKKSVFIATKNELRVNLYGVGLEILKPYITLVGLLTGVRLLQTVAGAYELTVNKNKQILSKIVLEKSNRVMQSDLAEKMRIARRYFTLEMSPPSNHELKILQQDMNLVWDFIQKQSFSHLTVKQAFLLFLVCTEVGLWFFMGETIGKMHFVGYKV